MYFTKIAGTLFYWPWGQVTRVWPGSWHIPQVLGLLAVGGLFEVVLAFLFPGCLPPFPPEKPVAEKMRGGVN